MLGVYNVINRFNHSSIYYSHDTSFTHKQNLRIPNYYECDEQISIDCTGSKWIGAVHAFHILHAYSYFCS